MRNELAFWQNTAVFYNGFMKFSAKAFRELDAELLCEVGPGSVVLEAAAGTGKISAALAPHVRQIACTDAASNMIGQARRLMRKRGLSNVECSVQDLFSLDFPDKSFDVAIASNVLHLLPDPEQAVRELLRVLKPGGRLILPTFILGDGSRFGLFLLGILERFGFHAQSKWTEEEYRLFLTRCELRLSRFRVIDAPIPLGYAVAKKDTR